MKQGLFDNANKYLEERDPPVLRGFPGWLFTSVLLSLLIYIINFRAFVAVPVFILVFLSLFIKWRMSLPPQKELIALVIIALFNIAAAIIISPPYNYTINSLGNRFFTHMANFLAFLVLLKTYKIKSRYEIYLTYIFSFLIVFVALYSVNQSEFITMILLSIYGIASIMSFQDFIHLSYPRADTGTKYRKKVNPVLIAALVTVLVLSILCGRYAKDNERHLESCLSRLGNMIPASFFPSTTYLGRMENMFQSKAVVMRIQRKGPPSRVVGKIYNRYRDGSWNVQEKENAISPLTQEEEIKAGITSAGLGGNTFALLSVKDVTGFNGKSLQRERYFKLNKNKQIFIPADYVYARANIVSVDKDSLGNFESSLEGLTEYDLFTTGKGISADSEVTGFTVEQDTEVPVKILSPVRQMTMEITRDSKTTFQKVMAIQEYLQKNHRYHTGVKLTTKTDPVLEFLQEKRSAHCEYFASAMALMLRSIGIPARYYVGFVVHERITPGDFYIVRGKDAHAWVTAYIPGKGWLEFDPTPPSHRPGHDYHGALRNQLEFLKMKIQAILTYMKSGAYGELIREIKSMAVTLFQSRSFTMGFFLVIIAVGILIFRKKIMIILASPNKRKSSTGYKYSRDDDCREMREILAAFDRFLLKSGIRRPENLTLIECTVFLKEKNMEPETLECCQEFLTEYSHERYGSDKPGKEAVVRLSEIINDLKHKSIK